MSWLIPHVPVFSPALAGLFLGYRERAPPGHHDHSSDDEAANAYARRPGSKPATRLARKHPLAGVSDMYSGDLDFMAASAHALGLCCCESSTH